MRAKEETHIPRSESSSSALFDALILRGAVIQIPSAVDDRWRIQSSASLPDSLRKQISVQWPGVRKEALSRLRRAIRESTGAQESQREAESSHARGGVESPREFLLVSELMRLGVDAPDISAAALLAAGAGEALDAMLGVSTDCPISERGLAANGSHGLFARRRSEDFVK